jgi:predicted acyltransferase (DUF342 family)
VEPMNGLGGLYVIADTIPVALIIFTFLLRYVREGRGDENEDDDDDDDE